jgi:glycosyltransferase involved in cell wall biosynthesis
VTQLETVVGDPVSNGTVANLTGVAVARPSESPLDVQLLVPDDDVETPVLSIVIPAKDEALTIREFVRWCKQGLDESGVAGEILIVDSSTDATPDIALDAGARVLKTPSRGLGRAYIDSVPYIRGRWVLMGDADCTYDFRQIRGFVDRFTEGYEFVMGSRWKGSIEAGSMPLLHQYLGTPVTTWMLNRLFSSNFTDIHCGMRGITRDALMRMRLQSQSWEYASEMVLKSVHMKLRTTEVPVSFLKDHDGRISHHKRLGWFSPFHAAWINLRAMFVHGADFFLFKPGLVLLGLGLLLSLPLTFGPVTVARIYFSLYWQLLGITLAILGLQSFYMGCVVQVLHDYTGAATRKWLSIFSYTRAFIGSAIAFLLGLGLGAALLVQWVASGFTLVVHKLHYTDMAVTGLLLMIAAFMTFTSTLLIHAVALRVPRGARTGR